MKRSLYSNKISNFFNAFPTGRQKGDAPLIATSSFLFRAIAFSLFWIISVSASLPSLATDYLFSSIGLSDGLVNPTVKCVLRDSRDYIWIGTKAGLNRYDKGEMRVYKRNPSQENTLPDNDIIEIFEDNRGIMWIVCATGVVTYNREKDNFNAVNISGKPLRARSHLLLPSGIVFGGAGNIFFYDYESGEIKLRTTMGGSDKYYTAIHPWTRNRYLLATRWDGLWVYNTNTGEIEPSHVVKGKRLIATYVDSDGDLWAAEYGKGLHHIDRTGKILSVDIEGIGEETIIRDITEKNGRMIFATDGNGIIIHDKTRGETHHIDTSNDVPRPLRSVNCLYKDNYDGLYAGSVRGGLFYITPTPIKTFPLSPENEAVTVTSLINDGPGVWIGTDGNGLIEYLPDSHNRVLPVEASSDLKIVSLDSLDENTLLISTYDSGLFLFDKRTRQLHEAPGWMQLISEENRLSGLPIDVKRLSGDRIALVTDKIYISDLAGKRVAVAEPSGPPSRLRIFYHDIGTLLCHSENEVFNLDLREESLSSIFKLPENIECCVYDGNRYIYAGTSSGVKQYDLETGLTVPTDPSSRMPSGSGVTSMAYIDNELWIGALGQLFLRNTKNGGLRAFGPNDGVAPNEFIYRAVLTTPGYLMMGGVNGLLKINLQEFPDYSHDDIHIPVELREVFIDGLPIPMQGNTAKLPDDYSTVKLRLTGGHTNPLNAETIRIFVGNKSPDSAIETSGNTLTLGHIQATRGGRYDLYASYKDINGQWTTPDFIGAILVPVAWWRKPFAIIIICVLSAALLIWVGIFLYLRRKNKVVNRIEEHRRQSLEKEVGFLMNLNYELRTPLTLIYSRLKMLTDKVNRGEISEPNMLEELDNIYRNTGKMRDIINTTVDLWRSGDMKTGEILEKIEVGPWIREILLENRALFQEKKLTVKTEGVKDHESMLCDLRRATIALINVLRSTISHAAEKSEIVIETRADDEHIKIIIHFYNDASHGAGEEFRYADHLMALMDGELTYTRYENGEPSIIVMEFPRELKRQTESAENMPGTAETAAEMEAANEDKENKDELAGFNLSHLTVLVVEDDPELRDLLVSSLSVMFNKVLEASNGKDALTYIKNSNPDLIITEARLPQMTGLELCRVIKKTKQYSHIPVIMLTTRLEEMSIANGNNFGADNYLTKPFDIGVLEKRCFSLLKSFDRVKQWYKSQVSDILPAEKRHNNDSEAFILKVREIIEENISRPGFGVDDIVAKMLISRSTLYGKFKDVTGQSLGCYINEYKLKKAKDMLEHTDMTMVEISDALGFATQRYFSTFFKDKTGMTPTSYRNTHASVSPKGV